MLIDSHCHLHDKKFFSAEEAKACLNHARKTGVEKIICIGTSHEDSLAAAKFSHDHEGVFWTYGIHPEQASTCGDGPFELPQSPMPPIAIGEVGLDYHYDHDRAAQIKLFEAMLQLAIDNNLPLSFHIREAFDDFFKIVANFPKIRAVVHSFTDSKKNLRRILEETDFYVGVNGLATYSTLPTPPLERTLLETDAPFLTPVPHRGEPNEPAFAADTARWLGAKLGASYEEVCQKTTQNAKDLFKI